MEILYAIKRPEVRECSVEGALSKSGYVFGGQQVRAYRTISSVFHDSANRQVEHLRRAVAGHHRNATFRQKTCIDARAATNFKNAIPGTKRLFKFLPNRCALSSAHL